MGKARLYDSARPNKSWSIEGGELIVFRIEETVESRGSLSEFPRPNLMELYHVPYLFDTVNWLKSVNYLSLFKWALKSNLKGSPVPKKYDWKNAVIYFGKLE